MKQTRRGRQNIALSFLTRLRPCVNAHFVSVFKTENISLDPLKKLNIGIVGFGHQARAQGLNLLDSGFKVSIGLREKSLSQTQAKKDGFHVLTISELVQKFDLVMLLIPDEVQAQVYKEEIEPFLSSNKILGFSHGFNLVFDKICLPKGVEYILVAPKATGIHVRRSYLKTKGVPLAVDWKSERSKDLTLAYARAIGGARSFIFKATLQEEVFSNLFSEQCALPGGLTELLKKSYEVLRENGVSPVMAYFECFYKLKVLVDLIDERGLEGFYRGISSTASFGALTSGPKIIDENIKSKMKAVFEEIKSGVFSKKDRKTLEDLLAQEKNHPLEKMFSEMRALLSPGFSKSENVFCETKKTFSDT